MTLDASMLIFESVSSFICRRFFFIKKFALYDDDEKVLH